MREASDRRQTPDKLCDRPGFSLPVLLFLYLTFQYG